MSEFKLSFNLDNASFQNNMPAAISAALANVINSVNQFEVSLSIGVHTKFPIRDIDGNRIGEWEFTGFDT